MTPDVRTQEEGRFHPLVLFWERESVFLAGGEILRDTRGLVLPETRTTLAGIQQARCPTGIVKAVWAARSGQSYSKQINGPELFRDLAKASEDWPTLLDRLPSLREVVDTLVAL